jgi:hypothetical protein
MPQNHVFEGDSMPMLSWLPSCSARKYAIGLMWDKYAKLHGEPQFPLPIEAVSFADYVLENAEELKRLEEAVLTLKATPHSEKE